MRLRALGIGGAGSLWRLRVKREWLVWFRQRWLWWVVIIGFVILVVLSRGELTTLWRTLLQSDPLWLIAAVLTQSAYYVLYTTQYKYGFATVEVASNVRELLPVMFASIFLRTIVPSGGVSGAAVFVDDAARRGQSAARAAEGSLLVLTADLTTLLPLVAIGLGYMAFHHVLVFYEVLGSVLFAFFAAGLAAVLFTGRLAPQLLRRGLEEVEWLANELARRLRRDPILPEGWAERNTADLARAARDIARRRTNLGRTVAVAGSTQLVSLATIHFVAQAFHQPLTLGMIIAGFSMQAVFSVVTVIPNGLVVAEGVMVAVLTSLGVPFGDALVITLVYRGLSVWLPLLVGFLFLRQVRSFGGRGR